VTWQFTADAQFYARLDSLDMNADRMDCAAPDACVGGPLLVSCPSTASCVHYGRASGFNRYLVTDSAPTAGALQRRDETTLRTTLTSVTDLHCFDPKHCITVGDQVVVTIDVE
jgi:hypothetical protein